MQKLFNFLHDRAKDLIELQRGGERFAEFVEDRNFARFPVFGVNRRSCGDVRYP